MEGGGESQRKEIEGERRQGGESERIRKETKKMEKEIKKRR